MAIATYNKMKNIIENRKTSIPTKKRIFKCYIESILLYNSELWTMTKKLNDEIDVFQRNQIRERSLLIGARGAEEFSDFHALKSSPPPLSPRTGNLPPSKSAH